MRYTHPSSLRMPILDGNDSEAKRAEIKTYFQYCYTRYEALFDLIADEKAYYQKADPLRHPLIFYYGHTATFFINKLKLAGLIERRIDPHMESVFAVGVDEMAWDDLDERHYDWPTLKETRRYRKEVYDVVSRLIETLPVTLPIGWESPWWVVLMGIEHENIHLETSSVLIRQLPLEMLQGNEVWPLCLQSGDAPGNSLQDVPSGKVSLGKPRNAHFYGWDNEYGRHEAHIPAFRASKYLVSNREYLDFVEDGGYADARWWDEEGNAWRAYVKAEHPRFWIKTEEGYRLRTLAAEIALPMNWPVEVNALEAEAFCHWKSTKEGVTLQLPTEDEYTRLRTFTQLPDYDVWMKKNDTDVNIALRKYASSVPVDRYGHGGFYDVAGNVWQWTRTPIYPFEGF